MCMRACVSATKRFILRIRLSLVLISFVNHMALHISVNIVIATF